MTIPSWARVGARIVCVETWRSVPGYGTGREIGPISGKVYTIRDVGEIHPRYPGTINVTVEEIRNEIVNYRSGRYEVSFGIYRFRPLTTTKTQAEDVAMIRSLIKDEVNA